MISENWYDTHTHLAELWAWLEERGETPSDGPAYFMEKPWKWTPEWEAYQAEQGRQRAERVRNRTSAGR